MPCKKLRMCLTNMTRDAKRANGYPKNIGFTSKRQMIKSLWWSQETGSNQVLHISCPFGGYHYKIAGNGIVHLVLFLCLLTNAGSNKASNIPDSLNINENISFNPQRFLDVREKVYVLLKIIEGPPNVNFHK